MHLSDKLRARISALGELSRPLGDARATALARALAESVAADVAHDRDTSATIDRWIRNIALEIAAKSPPKPTGQGPAAASRNRRSLADLLPEVC